MITLNEFLTNFIQLLQAYGVVGLITLSFAESSFFPIPPDILLIPMAFANRKLAIIYALVTTVASVLGGIFGHTLGRKFGKPLLKRFFKEDKINKVQNYFEKYGGWAVVIAGLTPIPYKIFTISAGVFNVRLSIFIISSIIGRGIRFFAEGLFIFCLGDTAKYYLENYFDIITIGITILCVMFYYVWKKLKDTGIVQGTGTIAHYKSKYYKIYDFMLKYKKYAEVGIYIVASACLFLLFLFIYLEL
ncbi:MAG: hypothetical protein PWR27_2214 [Petroclostridium sp.]|nr:phosphatase family protein [Clostridia bacterium]MDK2811505.1 hypothetical protein [Petroclostridium sp.]